MTVQGADVIGGRRRITLAAWVTATSCMAGCVTGPGGGAVSPPGGKGAPWTIQCLELAGPYRTQNATQFAETLRRTPGIRAKDVFVREEPDGFARLYYGTYYRRVDAGTGKRSFPEQMRKDLDLLKQLVDTTGRPYFVGAMPVRMPTPDVGKPEWALSRAKGEYTLQVGVFEPTDDFTEYKQAAAAFCALLRSKGYEAYYLHGRASSVVTVGAFGPDAVVTGATGSAQQSTYARGLVIGSKAVVTDSDGGVRYSNEVLALQNEELLKYNLVNGGIYKIRNPQGVLVPVPSRLVRIPRGAGG